MGLFSDCSDEGFFGGPNGGGCFTTIIILISSLALTGYGITKLCINQKNKKAKTEQFTTKTITPMITYNDVKVR